MDATERYRFASIGLTAVAGLLGLAGIAVGFLFPGPTAVYLLSVGVIAVMGAAYAQGNARIPYSFEDEEDSTRFRRELYDHVTSNVLLAILVLLVLVQVVSVLTALGYFLFLGEAAVLFVRYYNAVVGALLVLLSTAVLVRDFVPSPRLLSPRDRTLGLVQMGLTVLMVVASLVVNSGLLFASGLLDVQPNRSGFVLTFALFTLYLFVRTWARYPRLRETNTWLQEEERFHGGRTPETLVATFGGSAVLALAGAAVLHYSLGMSGAALALAGLANLLLLATPFGVGFTRVVAELEEGLEDYEARRRQRRVFLLSSSILHVMLAVLVIVVVAAAVAMGYVNLLASQFPAILLVTGLVGVVSAAIRTRIPTEDEFTELRQALGGYLSATVVVGTLFSLFLASEVAQGTLIGFENGTVLLLFTNALAVLYVKNRLLLPSLVQRLQEWYEDRVEEVDREIEVEERIQRSMIAAYLASLFLVLLGVGAIALMFVGVIPTPRTEGVRVGVGATWALVVIAVLGLALYRHVQRANLETPAAEEEEDPFTRRLTKQEVNRYLVLGLSISTAVVLFAMGVLVQAGIITSLAGIVIPKKFSTDFFVFALLLGLGPYGYFHSRELKRIRAMDERFPEFLRDLAESKRAGMTLTEAIITASKGTYGELTYEIRKMAAQLEWGVSFTDALARFSERVDTPLIGRTTNLIVEASNAGGNVVDVLTAAADDSREIQQILKERRDSMSIYVMIIYVAFLVFIGVIGILNAQFIPEISKAVTEAYEQGARSVGGLVFAPVDEQAFRTLFFHAAIIQGFGGGLVAGVMSGGKPVEGLKHAFLMISIAYVIFRFFLGA